MQNINTHFTHCKQGRPPVYKFRDHRFVMDNLLTSVGKGPLHFLPDYSVIVPLFHLCQDSQLKLITLASENDAFRAAVSIDMYKGKMS